MDMEFLQNVVNGNAQRFQGQNHGLGQSAPQGTYMTPGAYRRARQGLIAAIFMPIMWRTGRNWYERTGDGKIALTKAFLIVWYWKAWVFGCFAWFVLEMAGGYWGIAIRNGSASAADTGTWRLYCWLMWLVALPPLFLVYTRLVDMSLFKQRLLYRVIHPVDRWLHWCPWPVLLSMVMIPLFFLVQMGSNAADDLREPTYPTPSQGEVFEVPPVYDQTTGRIISPGS